MCSFVGFFLAQQQENRIKKDVRKLTAFHIKYEGSRPYWREQASPKENLFHMIQYYEYMIEAGNLESGWNTKVVQWMVKHQDEVLKIYEELVEEKTL